MYLGKAFPKFCLVITKQFLDLEKKIQPWGKNHWPFNLDAIMLPLAHTTIDTGNSFIFQQRDRNFPTRTWFFQYHIHLQALGLLTKLCSVSGLWGISWFRKKITKVRLEPLTYIFQRRNVTTTPESNQQNKLFVLCSLYFRPSVQK